MLPESRILLKAAGISHQGFVRKKNEDCFYLEPQKRFFLVADGVGGRHRGEVASRTACNYIAMRLPLIWNDLELERITEDEVPDSLGRLVIETSRYLKEISRIEAPGGMGTTVTGLLIWRSRGWVFHVGDTRCYIYNHGWKVITRDDSLVQSLIDSGVLNEKERRRFPYKNVITQALGLKDDIIPHIYPIFIKKGMFILLTSDGFHGFVEDSVWQKPLPPMVSTRGVENYISSLLELALEAGGKDNITLIGIKVR